MVGRRRKFLRCRCSKTASTLIFSLFLRVKILYLAPHKFTFLPFRSNFSSLFLHFHDVAPAITKLHKHPCMVVIALGEAQAKHVLSTSMLRKAASGQAWTRGSMQCIVFFSLVKLDINLKKITHSKKFSSKWIGSRRKI